MEEPVSSGGPNIRNIAVIATYPPSRLGLNEYTYHIVEAFTADPSVRVTVLGDVGGAERGEEPGVYNLKPNLEVRRCWALNDWKTLFTILKELKTLKPDSVWFNLIYSSFGNKKFPAFLGLFIPVVCRIAGYRTFTTLHHTHHFVKIEHTRFKSFSFLDKAAMEIAMRALLQTHEVFLTLDKYVSFLERRYGARNVRKMPHGFFFPAAKKSPMNSRKILVFGRFGGYKRLDFAISTFELLRKDFPDLRLVIAGEDHPAFSGYLAKFVDTLPDDLLPFIDVVGFVPETGLEQVFTETELLLMPYLSSTGVSGVAHLACSFGLPIVAPALPDFLQLAEEEGISMKMFEPNTTEHAAQVVRDLLNNPDEKTRQTEQNYKVAQLNSSAELGKAYLERMAIKESPRAKPLPGWAWILIALAIQGVWLSTNLQMRSYDGPIHLFLASHFSTHWFDSWNPKWYGGFDQISYPPLVHQLLALTSSIWGWLEAYRIVQFFTLFYLFIGIYRFCRIWLNPRSTAAATGVGVFSTSIAQLTYQFGQVPMLFSAAFLLNAVADAKNWIRKGGKLYLFSALAEFGVVLASHHITFFIGSAFFVLPVACRILSRTKQATQVRFLILLGLFILFVLPLAYPFVSYTVENTIQQVPIPHDTRLNLLTNFKRFWMFFAFPYGLTLLFFPYVFLITLGKRKWAPLGIPFGLAFLLGLGGTTPIARFVFRKLFDVLTFDRFSFWASLLILPFIGGLIGKWKHPAGSVSLILLMAATQSVVIEFGIDQVKIQPTPLDMSSILEFLNSEDHFKYRYLTLGFGSQMAWLGAQTEAPSIDGNYHTARPLPELRKSGIEALDGVGDYDVQGLNTLDEFLGNPQKYGLKYVFVNDEQYEYPMIKNGWILRQNFSLPVQIWEKRNILPVASEKPLTKRVPHSPAVMWIWGLYPLLVVATFLTQFKKISDRNSKLAYYK